MKIKIGICGLPNSGKSTLIKLISQIEVKIAPYPFTTLEPKEVSVPVISEEILKLHSVTKTPNLIPPTLTFVDVPGLIRGAHKGEGLGNEFLSYLRGCNVILEVVRNFQREDVPHPEGEIDPLRDVLIIEDEVKKADEKIILQNKKKKREELNLLIDKDWYLLVNGEWVDFPEEIKNKFKNIYFLDLLWELEIITELMRFDKSSGQTEFEPKVQEFLNIFRKDLELIQFFTFTETITQGWFAKKGSKIVESVGMIHSDFALKFKSAEVISLDDFLKIGDWEKAKKLGIIKNKSAESEIKENEIIFVKI